MKSNDRKRNRVSGKSAAQKTPRAATVSKRSAVAAGRPSRSQGIESEAAAKAGSKASTLIALMQRPDGATLAELAAASGWQVHSIRGFISGTLRKKMGLAIESTKREDGERTYSTAKGDGATRLATELQSSRADGSS